EAELGPLPGLEQVAGIARRGDLAGAVEARVPARVDPDLHRHAAGGGVVAARKGEHDRERLAVPVGVARDVAGVGAHGEQEAGDDQACPDVIQHARAWRWETCGGPGEYDDGGRAR